MKAFYQSALFTGMFLLKAVFSLADNYPKNFSIDILHYRFDLTLSDENNIIKGKTLIRFQIKKEGVDEIRLDFVNVNNDGNGMTVDGVFRNDKKLNFTHQNNELRITLGAIAKVGEEIEVIVHYHGVPADGLRIGRTKNGDHSFFNENWPNRARHWLPVVDHPYDKATSEFIVKAPAHYKVVSNGLLTEEFEIGATGMKLTHWKQSIPVSSWLFVLGVADFAVQHVGKFDGKSIQTWVYSKDRDAGFYDFAEPTKQVVEFFSDYIGPYQYEKIANVQTPSVKGGMETSSAIFYDENLIDGKRSVRLRNIVIHELAHQWFGNAVTETTWDESWLSEGFATYFTMLFIEHAYGREEFLAQLQSARAIAMKFIAENPDYKIIDDRSPEKTQVTSPLTYQKGAWVLHMLRNKIGDVAFKKGIQNYYRQYLNANATTDDFRKCMEEVSGQNLESFFNQWLKQGGLQSIQGTWSYDSEKKIVTIKMKQAQAVDFPFDLQVEVYGPGENMYVSKRKIYSKDNEIQITYAPRPEKVVLDPQMTLFANIDLKEDH